MATAVNSRPVGFGASCVSWDLRGQISCGVSQRSFKGRVLGEVGYARISDFVISLRNGTPITTRCASLPGDGSKSKHCISNSSSGKNLRWIEEDVLVSGDVQRSVSVVQALPEEVDVTEMLVELLDSDRLHPISNAGDGSVSILDGTMGANESHTMTTTLYRPKFLWFTSSEAEENRYIDRALNAFLAGAAIAYAFTKIVTVDHDVWHGWTVFEVLKYVPLHNWHAYEELLKSNPILAKMMISGIVYSIGDWIGQCVEGKPFLEFSRVRLLRSGLVGFCLHGSLSHHYYHICEYIFPFQGWWVVPVKVVFDQTIWSAIWNSIYFTTLGLLRLESPARILKDLKGTFFPLLTAGWKLWPFAHLITYGLVPVEQRLLWVDCVEIIWVMILSMFANEKSEQRLESGEEAALVLLSEDAVKENKSIVDSR